MNKQYQDSSSEEVYENTTNQQNYRNYYTSFNNNSEY